MFEKVASRNLMPHLVALLSAGSADSARQVLDPAPPLLAIVRAPREDRPGAGEGVRPSGLRFRVEGFGLMGRH